MTTVQKQTGRDPAASAPAPPSGEPGGTEDFAATVEGHMHARGMSVRATARAAGYSDHTLLSKVLNGHKPVTPYLAAKLDRALSAGGEIIAAAQPDIAAASAAPPRKPAAARHRHEPAAAAAGLVTWGQADAARLPLRELSDQAVGLGAWAETGTAGPATIATLDEEIGRIAHEYGTSQPGPLIQRASETCTRAARLLRQHQRLRHARDLYVVAARCCAFLAVALGDLGDQPGAAAYARTALTLAQESAEPGAVALAFSALSKVAFWDGSPAPDDLRRDHQRIFSPPLPQAGEEDSEDPVNRREFLSLSALTAAHRNLASELTASIAAGDGGPLATAQTTHGTDLVIAALTDQGSTRRLRGWMNDGHNPVLRVNATGILAKLQDQDAARQVAAVLDADAEVRQLYTTAVVARVGGLPWATAAKLAAGRVPTQRQAHLLAARLSQEVLNPHDAGARWCSASLLRDLSPLLQLPARKNPETL